MIPKRPSRFYNIPMYMVKIQYLGRRVITDLYKISYLYLQTSEKIIRNTASSRVLLFRGDGKQVHLCRWADKRRGRRIIDRQLPKWVSRRWKRRSRRRRGRKRGSRIAPRICRVGLVLGRFCGAGSTRRRWFHAAVAANKKQKQNRSKEENQKQV